MAKFNIDGGLGMVSLIKEDGAAYIEQIGSDVGEVYTTPVDEQALLNALFDSSHLDQSATTAGLSRRYIEAKAKKATLDALSREVSREIEGLNEQLVEHFADQGVTSVTVDGRMVYRSSTLWASMAEGAKDALVASLRDADLGDLTTVNHQSFSAYVREALGQWLQETGTKEEDALDEIRDGEFDWTEVFPTWGDKIKVTEKITLGVRKATSK